MLLIKNLFIFAKNKPNYTKFNEAKTESKHY